MLLITGLNIVGITVVRNANLVLVGLQLVFAAVFVVCAVLHVAQNPGVSLLQPLYDAGLTFPGLLAGAAMLALSFLGFDAISTLSEEARDAERTVPRAIILTTVIGGLIFTVIAYVSTLVIPNVADIENPDAAANQIMEVAAGRWLEVFFLVAYIAGCIAAALASQASVSRILFAMGRDGVLPRFFARLSRRYQTPIGAAIFVGVVSLAALFADLNTVASLISFGALAAFSLVNLSVIKHFLVDERRRGAAAVLRFGVLPALGFALTAWLWFSLSALALTVGLVWIGVGIVWLAVLTRGFRRRARGGVRRRGTRAGARGRLTGGGEAGCGLAPCCEVNAAQTASGSDELLRVTPARVLIRGSGRSLRRRRGRPPARVRARRR